ncbi:MAG: ribose-phosphate diphosphokinase [Candidatus Lokiarchaeota archaeon]|nr:ribose-phosphate diphosphokinase [Candidatus Lokiarchaeota archaeon]
MEKILIIGPASQMLGVRIGRDLGIKSVNTETKTFPDGENYLRINVDDETLIKNKEVIIIQSMGPSARGNQNARFLELLMMIESVKTMGAAKTIVIVPYLAYARQDKLFRVGECTFAKNILKIINSLNIDEFFTVDIHNPEVLEELSCKAINIDSMSTLAEYIQSHGVKDIVVVSPDKGAIGRSKAFARHFGENVPVDYFDKKRDVKTGEITMKGQLSLKNKDVIISDDIIATGGTMAQAIKLAKESGANKVFAVATHALMLQQATYKILNAGADEIIGTDSIDNEMAKVSLAKVISDYLKK